MEKNTARKVDREYSGELRLNWASQGGTLNIALKNKRESHVETWGIVLQRAQQVQIPRDLNELSKCEVQKRVK